MKTLLLATVLTLALCVPAGADTVVLDFEGLGNQDDPWDFYDGGYSWLGMGPGPDYGIEFSISTTYIDMDAGGIGNFANEPSPDTVLWFNNTGWIDVPAGFTTGFSFFYAHPTHEINFDPEVWVCSDVHGANGFAKILLPQTGAGDGDPNGGALGAWRAIGVAFSRTAKSVRFDGTGWVIFDNLTFGSSVPFGAVPLPPAALMGMGMIGGLCLIRRHRRRKAPCSRH